MDQLNNTYEGIDIDFRPVEPDQALLLTNLYLQTCDY